MKYFIAYEMSISINKYELAIVKHTDKTTSTWQNARPILFTL